MLRLLYRLIVQRVNEYRFTRSERKRIQSESKPAPAGSKRKRVAPTIVIAAIAFIAFAAVYRFQLGVPLLEHDPNTASIEIEFRSSDIHPAVIYLERIPPPLSPVPESQNTIQIVIESNQFIPIFQLVPAGSTIEIINRDAFLHNAHVMEGDDTVFNVATPLKRVPVRKTLTATGMLDVRCDLHPSMRGWIFVPPNPYYAVVEKSETILWSGIKAGIFYLKVWQTGQFTQQMPITLKPGERRAIELL